MLRVCAALDVRECVLRHGSAKGALDECEGGDVAIVHDGVDAEGEGVVVSHCCGRCCRGADMRKEHGGGGVCAETAEVGVVERGLNALVERRVQGGLAD